MNEQSHVNDNRHENPLPIPCPEAQSEQKQNPAVLPCEELLQILPKPNNQTEPHTQKLNLNKGRMGFANRGGTSAS